MSVSPASRLILVYRRQARALYGDAFIDDYQIIVPTLQELVRRERELRAFPKPFDEATRKQLQHNVRALSDFSSLLPAQISNSLRLPLKQDDDSTLHRKLVENVSLITGVLRERIPQFLPNVETPPTPPALPSKDLPNPPFFLRLRTRLVSLLAGAALVVLGFIGFREAGSHLTPASVQVSGYYRGDQYVSGYSRRPPGSVRHDAPYRRKRTAYIWAMLAGCGLVAWPIYVFRQLRNERSG